jgi:branched-chain amino acid transport system ATP-binding protein
MASQDTILSISGIAAVYSHTIAALHDVTLEVRRGEIVALLGANGAGKSTTLKAVSNLLPAERGKITGGSIHFDGHDVSTTSPSQLVRLGLVQVLEGRHCFRALSIEENLIVGGLGRGLTRSQIAQDLERVYGTFPRLKHKRRTAAGLTSGGEQQMAAIGRALMARPRLLILDEPSMGLAPLVVQDIFHRLKALNETEGLSILLAEQNSTIALRYADRAAILEVGVTVLEGRAADLRVRDDIKAFYLGQAITPGGSHTRAA